MSRPVTATNEEIEKALLSASGVLAHAATALGMSRQGLWKRIKGNAALEETRDTARAELLDAAESQLFKAVRAGKPWAIRFVLTRLGRERGYGATLSVDSQVVGRVVVYLPDDGREECRDSNYHGNLSSNGPALQSSYGPYAGFANSSGILISVATATVLDDLSQRKRMSISG